MPYGATTTTAPVALQCRVRNEAPRIERKRVRIHIDEVRGVSRIERRDGGGDKGIRRHQTVGARGCSPSGYRDQRRCYRVRTAARGDTSALGKSKMSAEPHFERSVQLTPVGVPAALIDGFEIGDEMVRIGKKRTADRISSGIWLGRLR